MATRNFPKGPAHNPLYYSLYVQDNADESVPAPPAPFFLLLEDGSLLLLEDGGKIELES
jgi:hypothetical protein